MFDRFVYQLVRRFCWIFLKLHNRLIIRGYDKVPQDRSYIVAANHCSNLDPIVIGATFPDQLRYLAKVELFEGSRAFAWLMKTLGAIPVSRKSSQSAGGALKAFLQLIEEKQNVLLFPEGARSLNGKLQPLEGGVALLALKASVPVVPVFISGTYKAMPVGSSHIGWNRVRVDFCDPVYPEEMSEELSSKEKRQLFLDKLSSEFQRLEAETLDTQKT